MRLLLVEDDKTLTTSLCAFLKGEVFTVEWVCGQQTCFQAMELASLSFRFRT